MIRSVHSAEIISKDESDRREEAFDMFSKYEDSFTNIFMNCPGKRRNGIKLRSIQ